MNESKRLLFEKKMGTMNFSKAHELGHWILHVIEQQDYEQLSFSESDTFFCRSTSKKHPQEIQADMFAASILMPKDIVCGIINQLKSFGNVGFPDLYRLIDKFEVSISALTNRVQELKLLHIVDGKIYHSEAEAMGQCSLF
jgi:Zn-dependent peptidase ImmA (M78 family)